MKNKSNIPVVILAGGNGVPLGENGENIPKAMICIHGKPMLQYIIEHYIKFGYQKFILCAGKGGEMITGFVKNYHPNAEITVVDTGVENRTGSRIAQIADMVKDNPLIALTYADTYSNVDLDKALDAHIRSGKTATLLAVNNPTRFRILGLVDNDTSVRGFASKPVLERDFINGGFYFMSKNVFSLASLTKDANCTFENEVFEELVKMKQLNSCKHLGMWIPVDCERDVNILKQVLK
ncbi:MAG: sugar phosphate nucleotidyltransferase [Chitinispirillia bacterium]|nr:sugar phosphate nucleotidyltransferase [Chitinispirillia bacterium]MCL2268775.1 sugar phosphate nucleotidyltransferase [Chitinispirillia bacterium]